MVILREICLLHFSRCSVLGALLVMLNNVKGNYAYLQYLLYYLFHLHDYT